jgi:purine-binding chemotaxis protein CheW
MTSDPQIQRIMEERARILGQVREDGAGQGTLEVMMFQLQDEVYAVELALLQGIQPVQGLTPIPGAPSHVAGILNVRGEILTVLNLGDLLGQPTSLPTDGQKVLLTEAAEGTVGFLVDDVLGMRELALGDIDGSTAGQGFSIGVVEARFSLLNLPQLLADRQLLVEDAV